MRKILFTLMFALGVMFLAPAPASANQAPASGSLFFEVLAFLALIALTAAGGGFVVMDKLKPRTFWYKTGYVVLALAAMVLSGAHEGYPLLLVLIVAIWSIKRGVKMIKWGRQALPGKERPDHLAEANPWRLIISGAVLIVLMVTIVTATYIYSERESSYRRNSYASSFTADAKNAYEHLKAYEAGNPRATGAVTCDDLLKMGLRLWPTTSCSSDIMIQSGKLVSGSIRITWSEKPGLMTPNVTKPEAVITYKGELTEAKQ